MNKQSQDFWERAFDSFGVAERELKYSPDNSASCSYYAAFNALSAWFSLEGKKSNTHDAIEIWLHRDLIKTGIFKEDLGKKYRHLRDSRLIGHYGGGRHVTQEDAEVALSFAKEIIEAVYTLHPDKFSKPTWMNDHEKK